MPPRPRLSGAAGRGPGLYGWDPQRRAMPPVSNPVRVAAAAALPSVGLAASPQAQARHAKLLAALAADLKAYRVHSARADRLAWVDIRDHQAVRDRPSGQAGQGRAIEQKEWNERRSSILDHRRKQGEADKLRKRIAEAAKTRGVVPLRAGPPRSTAQRVFAMLLGMRPQSAQGNAAAPGR